MERHENTDVGPRFLGRVITTVGDNRYAGIAGLLTRTEASFQALVDRCRSRRVLVGTHLVQGVPVLAVPTRGVGTPAAPE